MIDDYTEPADRYHHGVEAGDSPSKADIKKMVKYLIEQGYDEASFVP